MSSQYQIQDNFLFDGVLGSHRRKRRPSSLYLLSAPRILNILELGPVGWSDLNGANLNRLAPETEVGLVWFGILRLNSLHVSSRQKSPEFQTQGYLGSGREIPTSWIYFMDKLLRYVDKSPNPGW